MAEATDCRRRGGTTDQASSALDKRIAGYLTGNMADLGAGLFDGVPGIAKKRSHLTHRRFSKLRRRLRILRGLPGRQLRKQQFHLRRVALRADECLLQCLLERLIVL